ncbi:hypothetical protein BH20ACT21_BH20ACT21_14330 [soil metagenome]
MDESGDPGFGPGSQLVYLLIAIHMDEATLDDIRRHLANFRYHHNVRREFKNQKWASKLSPPSLRLLEFLGELSEDGRLTSTCTWLNKQRYRDAGAPYIDSTWRFRHYQIRRLLEVHIARRSWGNSLDVVIDRWQASHEQQADLLHYLRGNYVLRPQIANVTMVDSLYADPIQIADIYARLARRIVTESESEGDRALAARLMSLHEISRGLR